MIFVAVWTMIVVLYVGLTPKFMPSLAHVFAILALDALTMLFWFAAFIALAVFHRDLENTGIAFTDGFYYGSIYQTCSIIRTYCKQVEAAVVFGAFEWYVYVAHRGAIRRGRLRCASSTSLTWHDHDSESMLTVGLFPGPFSSLLRSLPPLRGSAVAAGAQIPPLQAPSEENVPYLYLGRGEDLK